MLHPSLADNVVEGGALAVAVVLVAWSPRRPWTANRRRRNDSES